MTTIAVNLPDDLGKYVADRAATEGYSDPSAFIACLLENNRLTERQIDLVEKVRKGFASLDRGEGRAMTKADWDRLRDGISQRHGLTKHN